MGLYVLTCRKQITRKRKYNSAFHVFLSLVRLIIGPKRDEVTEEWRKLHNEELRDLYSSPSIFRIIKSTRMRWAGHVARMGRRGTRIGYWWGSQRERDHLEDQDVGGWIILGWIFER
jgi:hypothetical protein